MMLLESIINIVQ